MRRRVLAGSTAASSSGCASRRRRARPSVSGSTWPPSPPPARSTYIVADPFRTVGLSTDIAAFKAAARRGLPGARKRRRHRGRARPARDGGPSGRYGKIQLPTAPMMRAARLNSILDGADGLAFFNSCGPTKWHLPSLTARSGNRSDLAPSWRAPRATTCSRATSRVVVPVADGGGPADWPFIVRGGPVGRRQAPSSSASSGACLTTPSSRSV